MDHLRLPLKPVRPHSFHTIGAQTNPVDQSGCVSTVHSATGRGEGTETKTASASALPNIHHGRAIHSWNVDNISMAAVSIFHRVACPSMYSTQSLHMPSSAATARQALFRRRRLLSLGVQGAIDVGASNLRGDFSLHHIPHGTGIPLQRPCQYVASVKSSLLISPGFGSSSATWSDTDGSGIPVLRPCVSRD